MCVFAAPKEQYFLSLMITIALLILIPGNHTRAHHHDTVDPQPVVFNQADLEAFLDGTIQAYMDKQHLAGATIGIIQNGEVLLLKGYGHANIEYDIHVDPAVTLFRIGSVSKLFTWLAILQQIELGRLDLDEDINNYIEAFKIPDTFDEPITIRSLLTHTPGFEDVLLELFIREGNPIPALEEIFRKKIPKRIMPPLQEAAYSNHGTGLAQYLVELASGMPFEDYVEEFILNPLGMYCTTFRQPLPDHLQPYMSNGYAYRNGRFEKQGFELVPMTGAGGASTTAKDMMIFMDALLNYTRLDTISLMDSATYAIMKEPLLKHAPHMNPALHGFMDISPANVRMIGHGGNTFLFHSLLALFPEHNTGVFMSFNSENGGGTYADVIMQFIKRYFPPKDPIAYDIHLEKEYLEGFAGRYIANRRPHSDVLKIIGIMNSVEITACNNTLHYYDFLGNQHELIPVDSTTFFSNNKQLYIGFNRDPDYRATKLYVSNFPIIAFDRLKGLYLPQIHLFILIITILVIVYVLVVWPFMYFVRINYDRKPKAKHPLPIFTKLVAWVASLFLFLFYVLLMYSTSGGNEIVFGVPNSLRIALFFPIAAIPFILLMIWNSLLVWKAKQLRKRSRVFYNIATIAFVLSIWQLHFWNLLGWKF